MGKKLMYYMLKTVNDKVDSFTYLYEGDKLIYDQYYIKEKTLLGIEKKKFGGPSVLERRKSFDEALSTLHTWAAMSNVKVHKKYIKEDDSDA